MENIIQRIMNKEKNYGHIFCEFICNRIYIVMCNAVYFYFILFSRFLIDYEKTSIIHKQM